MAVVQSRGRPYREGDTVHFSTYARKTDIFLGTIERVGDAWGQCEHVRVYFIRETRTQELYATSYDLIYGFAYS